jgi:hypothetical protein
MHPNSAAGGGADGEVQAMQAGADSVEDAGLSPLAGVHQCIPRSLQALGIRVHASRLQEGP